MRKVSCHCTDHLASLVWTAPPSSSKTILKIQGGVGPRCVGLNVRLRTLLVYTLDISSRFILLSVSSAFFLIVPPHPFCMLDPTWYVRLASRMQTFKNSIEVFVDHFASQTSSASLQKRTFLVIRMVDQILISCCGPCKVYPSSA